MLRNGVIKEELLPCVLRLKPWNPNILSAGGMNRDSLPKT